MIEVTLNFYIGNQSDYETNVASLQNWFVIHACKEPFHRNLLGYSGKGAPKGHPEYLLARRENRLFLNLVDAADPSYIPKEIIDTALKFIEEALSQNIPVLLHCNLGESRSPSIGLLFLAINELIPNSSLQEAEQEFQKIYTKYNPKTGMRGFLEKH
ncbi:dual specificity protein phosphatase family protein [Leptospira adleri]|uniref:Phosphatase n=1 Tax=Leptospira adleri TaxID=2023186 RepID=A0ABX4NVU4_9LEPT|nr:dual specificity protein phosphatase family protein [Leptospira adleri]PJZ60804.1 phosphatase [Leptospira adleri]